MVCGVGHNDALDRTMSAMGKILIDPVNGKAISDIDGQSDRDDVANRVFLLEKHSSDLLAVSQRNVDLKRFFTSGDCWSCAWVAGDGTETIRVQCISQRFRTILLCCNRYCREASQDSEGDQE